MISTLTGCISGWVDRTSDSALRFTSVLVHQLNLGAVKILVVFAIDRALADIQFAGEHHLARGKERGRRLEKEPRFDK